MHAGLKATRETLICNNVKGLAQSGVSVSAVFTIAVSCLTDQLVGLRTIKPVDTIPTSARFVERSFCT